VLTKEVTKEEYLEWRESEESRFFAAFCMRYSEEETGNALRKGDCGCVLESWTIWRNLGKN
jgi:hypothetical protein